MTAGTRARVASSPAVALLGDCLVFVIFAVVGLRQHNEAGPIVEVATIVWPFALAWTLVAWARGLFNASVRMSSGIAARSALIAWAISFPFALVLRAAIEHRAIPVGFDVVALVFNGGLLAAWRAARTFGGARRIA